MNTAVTTATRTAHAVLRHELRLLASLVLWVTRRTHGTEGKQAFGYARGQAAMMYGFAFVCVVETVAMSVLLRELPVLHAVLLVLDVYTVLFVLGMHAASVVRPHVLDVDARSLRVRQAGHIDLRIPLERIASVRRELRMTHTKTDGRLDLPIGSQTTITLELAEPVTHFGFTCRQRPLHLVRFHADDADGLVKAIKQAMEETLTETLTPARTAPSRPLPGRPG
ncbi:hypothetical protein [Streptomyces sp. NPDC088794]|uniref:hypothetical protein n=1 Tax=Streptomyces sp. NPDC088794 TaxID=3365902 RepID=UPI00382EB6F8